MPLLLLRHPLKDNKMKKLPFPIILNTERDVKDIEVRLRVT